MVVLDANMLLLMMGSDAKPPKDPRTGQPIERAKERIDHLIATLDRSRTKVLVPTPVLSEILVRAGDAGPNYLEFLNASARFKIVPFDTRAAVEVAALTREALDSGDKRGGSKAAWAKVKFDRQIVAIARTEGATAIYSDDEDIGSLGERVRIQVVRLIDLPVPPADSQLPLPWDASQGRTSSP